MGQIVQYASRELQPHTESLEIDRSLLSLVLQIIAAAAVIGLCAGVLLVDVKLVEGGYLTQPHSH